MKAYLRQDLGRTEPFICDYFISRYCTARKWDLEKTKTMLINYFTFRDRMLPKMEDYRARLGIYN